MTKPTSPELEDAKRFVASLVADGNQVALQAYREACRARVLAAARRVSEAIDVADWKEAIKQNNDLALAFRWLDEVAR